MHRYVRDNPERAWKAVSAIERGDARELGDAMVAAQVRRGCAVPEWNEWGRRARGRQFLHAAVSSGRAAQALSCFFFVVRLQPWTTARAVDAWRLFRFWGRPPGGKLVSAAVSSPTGASCRFPARFAIRCCPPPPARPPDRPLLILALNMPYVLSAIMSPDDTTTKTTQQASFDECAIPICPSEFSSPLLHKVMSDER